MKILFVDPDKPFLAPAGIIKLGGTRMSRLSRPFSAWALNS